MKKIICILLALVMIFGFSTLAFADENNEILVISPLILPKPVTVYVNVNDKCQLATTKDGKLAVMLEVNIAAGSSIDDALRLAHELYCAQGAEAYESENTDFGISLLKAWGCDNGLSYGYYVNNQMAFSLADEIHDGDVIDLFVYKDMASFSDKYTKIESVPAEENGQTEVTVSYFYFDESFAMVSAPLEDAVITFIKNDEMISTDKKTDADGKCLLNPDEDVDFLAAVKEDCVVSVTKPLVKEAVKNPDTAMTFEDYSDLNAGEWYEPAIRYFIENGFAKGTGNSSFSPSAEITKGEVLTMLWRMEGEIQANLYINYDDVEQGQWYTEAVRWALAKGMLEPKSSTTFGVADLCTREEVASMIYKYIQSNGGGFTGSWLFPWDKEDKADVASEYMEACMFLSMHHIMQGQSAVTFNPKKNITRAEVCQIIYNYMTEYSAK